MPRVARERPLGPVPIRESGGGRFAPGGERRARLAPRVERFDLRSHDRAAAAMRLNLLAVERDLLLLAVDGQFPRVRAFPRGGRPRLRFDQFNPR